MQTTDENETADGVVRADGRSRWQMGDDREQMANGDETTDDEWKDGR